MGLTRARTVSSPVQAYAPMRSCPSGGPASASTSPAEESSTQAKSGAHSGRAATKARSSSTRAGTSPAGGLSEVTAVRSRASSQAVPTSGWPAKLSSTVGVKIRTTPAAASSTNTVSLNPSTAAAACRSRGGSGCSVEEHSQRVAAIPVPAAEDTQDV